MLTPFHPIMEPITKLHPCLMNASLNVHVIFQVLKYMYIHAAAKPMQYSQCTRVLAALPRCPYSLHRRTGWLDIWIGMWLVCCMTVGALECVHHPRLPQGSTVRISIRRWTCRPTLVADYTVCSLSIWLICVNRPWGDSENRLPCWPWASSHQISLTWLY